MADKVTIQYRRTPGDRWMPIEINPDDYPGLLQAMSYDVRVRGQNLPPLETPDQHIDRLISEAKLRQQERLQHGRDVSR